MKLIFCQQMNIELSYKLIPLILMGMARPAQIAQNNMFPKSLQYLKKEVRDEVNFLCRLASVFHKLILSFWWVLPGMVKVLKMTNMQCLCNISRKNWVMKLMICMLINMKVFYKLIVLFLMGLARHFQNTWLNLQCILGYLKKEVRNEVRDLTALAGLNTAHTIYYTSNVWPFFSFNMESISILFLIRFFVLNKLIVIVSSYGRSI